jgi:hypothetical protein
MEEGVPGELAPADLGEEASDVGSRRHRGVPHLERAELSPAQPRRQHRGRASGGLVAGAVVVGDILGEELVQAAARGQLAGRPALAQPARPVRSRRQEAPVVEVVGCRVVDAPRSSRGSGSGSRGAGSCWHAFQNGVNTP